VDDEIDEALAADIRDAFTGAAQQRAWSLGPPEFVYSGNDDRTLGCVLALHPARDEHDTPVAVDLDEASLNDTKALVALLAPISLRRHVVIGIELDGDSTGWLLNGEPDASLAVGLIAAWEARVRAAGANPE
jgi:hypothetical protein